VLLHYQWPGNIRQLENALERACVTTMSNEILPESLPPDVLTPSTPKLPFEVDLNRPLGDVLNESCSMIEQQYIRKALEKESRERRPLRQDLRFCRGAVSPPRLPNTTSINPHSKRYSNPFTSIFFSAAGGRAVLTNCRLRSECLAMGTT